MSSPYLPSLLNRLIGWPQDPYDEDSVWIVLFLLFYAAVLLWLASGGSSLDVLPEG